MQRIIFSMKSVVSLAFGLAFLSEQAALAGPYPYWFGANYSMMSVEVLWPKSDERASQSTRGNSALHRLHVTRGGEEDKENVCFMHVDHEVPSLIFCESKKGATLSSVVWRRRRGNDDHFECISGCSKKIPRLLSLAIDNEEGDQ